MDIYEKNQIAREVRQWIESRKLKPEIGNIVDALDNLGYLRRSAEHRSEQNGTRLSDFTDLFGKEFGF